MLALAGIKNEERIRSIGVAGTVYAAQQIYAYQELGGQFQMVGFGPFVQKQSMRILITLNL